MNKEQLKKAVAEVTKLEGGDLDKAIGDLIVAKENASEELNTIQETAKKEAEAASNAIEELTSRAETAEEKVADLTSRAETAEEKVADLESQLAAAKEDPETLNRCDKTFKVGKKEYRFKPGVLNVVVPGRILEDKKKAGTHTAEEVAEDKEMREALVDIEYGGIEEVPTK